MSILNRKYYTFPVREDAAAEFLANRSMIERLDASLDMVGMAAIEDIIDRCDALAVQRFCMDLLGGTERI